MMDMMDDTYKETTALIAVSGVFLALGAVFALIVIADMLWRQAWRSMMLIMFVYTSHFVMIEC